MRRQAGVDLALYILFFLPGLFVVILTPAIIQVFHYN